MLERKPLPTGTKLQLQENTTYEVIGSPIGFGGSSIIYNVRRILADGSYSGIMYTLKECYERAGIIRSSYTGQGLMLTEHVK